MRTANSAVVILVPILVMAILTVGAWGGVINSAITRAADRLATSQAGDGSWAGETDYTGSIVAGMVNAYQVTGTAAYKTAAEDGGNWILTNSGSPPNYYGDGAYALTRLSEVSADPSSNPWRTAVADFYTAVKNSGGGTGGYISGFTGTEPSTAVFYLAHHAVAASYVNAADKALWRDGVVEFLATVNDTDANYPVLALGVATWALSQTGPMDGTYVDPTAPPGSYWHGVALADLPGLLAGHQVASGDNAGSFYWRFDHAAPDGGDPSGFTEDTVFGTLGLLAADEADPSLGFDDEILAARQVLAGGVASDGKVYEHIWSGGATYHVYAGETLQALPEPTTLALLGLGGALLLGRRHRQA